MIISQLAKNQVLNIPESEKDVLILCDIPTGVVINAQMKSVMVVGSIDENVKITARKLTVKSIVPIPESRKTKMEILELASYFTIHPSELAKTIETEKAHHAKKISEISSGKIPSKEDKLKQESKAILEQWSQYSLEVQKKIKKRHQEHIGQAVLAIKSSKVLPESITQKELQFQVQADPCKLTTPNSEGIMRQLEGRSYRAFTAKGGFAILITNSDCDQRGLMRIGIKLKEGVIYTLAIIENLGNHDFVMQQISPIHGIGSKATCVILHIPDTEKNPIPFMRRELKIFPAMLEDDTVASIPFSRINCGENDIWYDSNPNLIRETFGPDKLANTFDSVDTNNMGSADKTDIRNEDNCIVSFSIAKKSDAEVKKTLEERLKVLNVTGQLTPWMKAERNISWGTRIDNEATYTDPSSNQEFPAVAYHTEASSIRGKMAALITNTETNEKGVMRIGLHMGDGILTLAKLTKTPNHDFVVYALDTKEGKQSIDYGVVSLPETEIVRNPILWKALQKDRTTAEKNDFIKFNCTENDVWVDLENNKGVLERTHSPKNKKA